MEDSGAFAYLLLRDEQRLELFAAGIHQKSILKEVFDSWMGWTNALDRCAVCADPEFQSIGTDCSYCGAFCTAAQ